MALQGYQQRSLHVRRGWHQEAYDRAVTALFEALDKVEAHFASHQGRFWFGDDITEVDIRL